MIKFFNKSTVRRVRIRIKAQQELNQNLIWNIETSLFNKKILKY